MTDSVHSPAAGKAERAVKSDSGVRPLADPVAPLEIVEALPAEIEEIGEVMRQSAELGVEKASAAFERAREAAGEATSGVEASLAAAAAGVAELNLKALDAVKSNAFAAYDLVLAIAGARTLSEIVVLQTEHVRKQFETMNAQAQELAELAGKVSARAVAPLSDTIGKTFGAPA